MSDVLPESVRSRQFERDFLECGTHQAQLGSMGFEDLVLERLVQGQKEYGESFLLYTLVRFIREMAEEGRDVAGWATGMAQCEEFNALPIETRQEAMRWLLHLVSLGAQVEYATRQLVAVVE